MKKSLLYLFSPLLLGLSQTASAGDLLAWWNFNTLDSTRTFDVQAGHFGLVLEGAQSTAPGSGRSGAGTDRGMLFGNSRHRVVVDAAFLNVLAVNNKVSVAYWQKLASVRNQTTFFIDSPSSTNRRGLATHSPWSDGTIYWDGSGCCNDSNRVSFNPGATWTDWNHMVLVKDGDTKYIYFNGVEVFTGQNTAPLVSDFTELFIGNSSNFNEAVEGVLDDFAIYKRALTPAEVALLAGGATPASIVGSNDTDGDSLPDAWEERFGPLTALTSGAGDPDLDGLTNTNELALGTKPNSDDSDGDGFKDGVETGTGIWVSATNTGTSAWKADTDGDGLNDGAETNTGTFVNATNAGTNPHVADTDGDTFSDGSEVVYGTSNPTNAASRPLRPGQLDLLAYWDFNNATDATKTLDIVKGFPGTLKGTTVYTANGTGRTGLAGDRAIDMGATGNSGTGVLVSGGGFMNIAAAQNQVAISWWQKLSGTPDSSSIYAQSSSMERAINIHSPWSNGEIYWDTAGCCDGGTQRINFAGGLTLGVWEHVVVNKNGNLKAIWVNGVKIREGNNTGVFPTNFTRFFIGTDGGLLNMAGLMDEVAVYGDALTDAQIALLFAGTKPNAAALVPPNEDTDGDGMQNAYEDANGLNKNVDDRFGDVDADGLNNITEFLGGTKPNNPDTDGDGLADGAENKSGIWVSITNTGTDPLKADSDGDGLGDKAETNTGTFVSLTDTGTNPNKSDTDGDKWPDLTEINWPSDPLVKSSVPALDPTKLDLLAFWDFNDNSNPALAKDSQHSLIANFLGTTTHSAVGEGRTGTGTDRAMNLGTAGGNNGARVDGARWFNLGIPRGRRIANLGSLGSDGDMSIGTSTVGTPGALTGNADTAITTAGTGTRAPYNPALNPTGPWTAEVWLKPAVQNPAGTLTCAISCGDFGDPRKGWLIYQSDTGWNLRTYFNSALAASVNITGNNGAAPVAGEWTHVVIKWDGSKGTVYVDGLPRVTSDPRTYVAGIAGGFAVGSRADAGFPWAGDADEVAFYNTALSDAVIKSHFDNGKAAVPAVPYNTLVLASAPVGYWRMTDATAGQEVKPDQVSISFWQKLDSISNSSAFWAVSPSSNNGLRGFQAHTPWSDGQIYFDTAGCCDAGTQRLNGAGDVTVGEWTHFVIQKNGPIKEVWKNGTLLLSGEGANPMTDDITRLFIGAEQSGDNGANGTRGLIDDFAVFGEFLTEAQIIRLAAGSSPPSIVLPAPTASFAITQITYNAVAKTVSLTWESLPGKSYIVQASSNMTEAVWPFVVNDNVPSGGATTTFVHNLATTFPAGAPARLYYRVRQKP